MTLTGLGVERAARGKDRYVVPGVTVAGRDEADAAVLVLPVVPVDETRDPLASLLDAGEAARRILRAVLEGLEQRLDERVVVGHARSAERRHDAEALQRRQHRRALHRAAVVRVKHPTAQVEAGAGAGLTNALDECRGKICGLAIAHVVAEDLPAPHVLDEVQVEELTANEA